MGALAFAVTGSHWKNQTDPLPLFVDTAGKDFHLQPSSPMIDAGAFLAHTVGGGSGTTMGLDDAGYFRDAYGIADLGGDTMQLQGDARTAAITAIDYATNTVTLSAPLSWTGGQGVSLKYHGAAPDIGALEFEPPKNGVRERAPGSGVQIYPNPSPGTITIFITGGVGRNPRVRIVDVLGRSVYDRRPTQIVDGRELLVEPGQLATGVYVLEVVTEEEIRRNVLLRESGTAY